MSNPTREEVLASIVPKSDQLNADDLLTGPLTVTITKVCRGDGEQPIVVEIEGHQPYKPCKSMRRVMIATWTDEPSKWIGQRMTLFCDPEVTWGGVKVGGIRISHISGIDKPRPYMLTKTRGKKVAVIINPLAPTPSLTDEEAHYIIIVTGELSAVATLDELKGHGAILKTKSKAVQDALRPAYAKRLKELNTPLTEGE